MAFDRHRPRVEYLGEQPGRTQRCERPAPVRSPLILAALADTGKGSEKYTARTEDAVYRPDRSADLINEMQGLGEDDAVESVTRQLGAITEIGNQTDLLRPGEQVENLRAVNPAPTEPAGITVASTLQHRAADGERAPAQPPSDRVAI